MCITILKRNKGIKMDKDNLQSNLIRRFIITFITFHYSNK